MTEAFGIRAIVAALLMWSALFVASASGLVDELMARPLLREGNHNLDVGLVQLLFAGVFFFFEEDAVAKFRLGREQMAWWEPLPLCAAINVVAAVLFIESLAINARDG